MVIEKTICIRWIGALLLECQIILGEPGQISNFTRSVRELLPEGWGAQVPPELQKVFIRRTPSTVRLRFGLAMS